MERASQLGMGINDNGEYGSRGYEYRMSTGRVACAPGFLV